MNNKIPLGEHLKRMRQERNWSLAELSKRSGIAASTLSKVENNSLSMTFDRLCSVADALDVTLSQFISGEPDNATPGPTGRFAVAKLGSGEPYDTAKYAYEYLCTSLTMKHMFPSLVTIKHRSMEEFGDMSTHKSEEFAFVVQGRVVVYTEYYSPVTLEEGEGVYLDGGMGHAFINSGEGEARALIVHSAP